MKKQFTFSPLVLIAVALMSTLMLALFFGIASAGIPPPTCLPDGRPAFEIVRGPENLEITILAIEQNGTENKIKGKLDAQGNGTIPFGEPGVLYTQVLVGFAGYPGPVGEFKNVKCDPPQTTLQSILEDPKRNWGRIQNVITDWLTHWF
jgi:hypothetical protein